MSTKRKRIYRPAVPIMSFRVIDITVYAVQQLPKESDFKIILSDIGVIAARRKMVKKKAMPAMLPE